jgi:CBS domain-containing protein
MTPTLADIAALPISGIDQSKPLRVSMDATVFEVVQKLHDHDCSAALVENDGALVGIFTERDLMARVDHSNPAWRRMPVAEVMTKAPNTIRLDQTVEEALNLMLLGVYRHLPTVTAAGKTEGMLSILDLLVHITEYFPDEFVNLPVDPEHEAKGPWGG